MRIEISYYAASVEMELLSVLRRLVQERAEEDLGIVHCELNK